VFVPLFILFLLMLIAIVILVGIIAVPVAIVRHLQPHHPPSRMAESQYADDARRLVREIKETLKTCPIAYEQKTELLRQVRDIPAGVVRALHRLQRLRRIRKIARRSADVAAAVLDDIARMERQIVDELRRTHETLLEVPVALMKVDVARGERNLDRIIAALSETNQRLNDLADSYGEVRAERSMGYP